MAATPKGTQGLILVCIGTALIFLEIYLLVMRAQQWLPLILIGCLVISWGLSLIRKSKTRV